MKEKRLLIVIVLKGAFMVGADLIRYMQVQPEVHLCSCEQL